MVQLSINVVISIIIMLVIIVAVVVLLSGVVPGTKSVFGDISTSLCNSFKLFCAQTPS